MNCQEVLSSGKPDDDVTVATQKLVEAIAGYKHAAGSVKSLSPKAKAAGGPKGKAKAKAKAAAA